jgi:hypothetical protein
MQINRLLTQKRKTMSTNRKLETRTKIQLGGLIIKSGLADLLNIHPGDDLQSDTAKHGDAQVLLGLLVEASEKLSTDEEQREFWQKLGKMHVSKTTYNTPQTSIM